MAQDGDNRRNLYDALKDTYDLGSYEDFCKSSESVDNRKALYDAIRNDYDVGETFEDFDNSFMGTTATASGSGTTKTPTESKKESNTPLPTGQNMNDASVMGSNILGNAISKAKNTNTKVAQSASSGAQMGSELPDVFKTASETASAQQPEQEQIPYFEVEGKQFDTEEDAQAYANELNQQREDAYKAEWNKQQADYKARTKPHEGYKPTTASSKLADQLTGYSVEQANYARGMMYNGLLDKYPSYSAFTKELDTPEGRKKIYKELADRNKGDFMSFGEFNQIMTIPTYRLKGKDGKVRKVSEQEYTSVMARKAQTDENRKTIVDNANRKIAELSKERESIAPSTVSGKYRKDATNPRKTYTNQADAYRAQYAKEARLKQIDKQIAEQKKVLWENSAKDRKTLNKNIDSLQKMVAPMWKKAIDEQGGEITRAYSKRFAPERTDDERKITEANWLLEEAKELSNAAEANMTGSKSAFVRALNGFTDSAFDLRTWDYGATDLLTTGDMNRIAAKFSKDKSEQKDFIGQISNAVAKLKKGAVLSASDELLLKASLANQAAHAMFDENVGTAYKAGKTTAESLPFMVEFMVNPLSGTGTTMMSRIGRYGKLGRKLATNVVERGIAGKAAVEAAKESGKGMAKAVMKDLGAKALKTGLVAADETLRGAGMALTTGGVRTLNDVYTNMNGEDKYVFDDEGNIQYAGREDDNTLGSAIMQAIYENTVENASEMFGTHLTGIGKGIRRNLGKVGKAILGGEESDAYKAVNSYLNNISKSDMRRMMKDFQKQTGWNGSFEEYLEEVYGNTLNAMAGYMDWTNEEGTGALDFKQNFDTFCSVALMSGAMSAVNTMGYSNAKTRADRKLAEADEVASSMFTKPVWDALKKRLDEKDDDELSKVVHDEIMERGLPDDMRKAFYDYIYALKERRGVDVGEDMGRKEIINDVSSFRQQGNEIEQPMDAYNARKAFEQASNELGNTEYRSIIENAISSYLNGESSLDDINDTFAQLPEEEQELAKNYLQQSAVIAGIRDQIDDKVNQEMNDFDDFNKDYIQEVETEDGNKTRKMYYSPEHGQFLVNYNPESKIELIKDEDGNVFQVPTSTVGDVEEVDYDAYRANTEQGIRKDVTTAISNMLNHHPDTVVPSVGKTFDTKEGRFLVKDADANGNVKFVSITEENQDGNIVPVEGTEVMTATADEIMDAQDQHYDPTFEEDVKPTEKVEEQPTEETAEQPVEQPTEEVQPQQATQEVADARQALVDAGLDDVADNIDNGANVDLTAFGNNDARLIEAYQNALVNQANQQNVQPSTNPGVGQPTVSGVTTDQMGNPIFFKGDGTPMVDEASAEQYIYNESGLDEAMGDMYVQGMIDDLNNGYTTKKGGKAVTEGLKQIGEEPKISDYHGDLAKFRKEHDEWKQKYDRINGQLQYWQNVQKLRKKLKDEKSAQAIADNLASNKPVTTDESNVVGQNIKDKWNDAPKVDGNKDLYILVNGDKVTGHYVLTESGAVTPSHQVKNGFLPSEGFPVDENGQTINDRDYYRNKDAQKWVLDRSNDYTSQALQTPIAITNDGVVLSGNGRTMAGELAAEKGKDKDYVDYLNNYGAKLGFTPEQVASMKHPRVFFLLDNTPPYNTETMTLYNTDDKKGQSTEETAVKNGKLFSDESFGRLLRLLNDSENWESFYSAENSATILREMQTNSMISAEQIPTLMDGDVLNQNAKQMFEMAMLGKSFEKDPDALRKITEYKNVRRSVLMALQAIASNKALGNDFSLDEEITNAIGLVYEARKAGQNSGDNVSAYTQQLNLFEEDAMADYKNAKVMILADALNDKKISKFRDIVKKYNELAQEPASGQTSLFEDAPKTKDEVFNQVLQILKLNGNETAENEQGGEEAAPADSTPGTGGEGSEQEEVNNPDTEEPTEEGETDNPTEENGGETSEGGENNVPLQGDNSRETFLARYLMTEAEIDSTDVSASRKAMAKQYLNGANTTELAKGAYINIYNKLHTATNEGTATPQGGTSKPSTGTGKPSTGETKTSTKSSATASAEDRLKGILGKLKRDGAKSSSALNAYSIETLTPAQVEDMYDLIDAGAEVGYNYLVDGVESKADWIAKMKGLIAEPLMDATGYTNTEVDDLMNDLWNAPYEHEGETKNISDWAKDFGINENTEDNGEQENGGSDLQGGNGSSGTISGDSGEGVSGTEGDVPVSDGGDSGQDDETGGDEATDTGDNGNEEGAETNGSGDTSTSATGGSGNVRGKGRSGNRGRGTKRGGTSTTGGNTGRGSRGGNTSEGEGSVGRDPLVEEESKGYEEQKKSIEGLEKETEDTNKLVEKLKDIKNGIVSVLKLTKEELDDKKKSVKEIADIVKNTGVKDFDKIQAHLKGNLRAINEKLRAIFAEQPVKADDLSQEKVPYQSPADPSGEHAIGSVVPSGAQENLMRAYEQLRKETKQDILDYVRDKLGYSSDDEMFDHLSAEQVDAAAFAINAMEHGKSYIIGDMTGVGKGREAASVISWAVRSGKKVLFLTENPELFSDMYRDLSDIGFGYLKPMTINEDAKATITDSNQNVVYKHTSKKVLDALYKSGKTDLPNEPKSKKPYDFVMASYSQFGITADNQHRKNQDKLDWIKSYAKDAIIVMDESHNAAGESIRGYRLQNLVKNALGVTFLSATYAKTPESMVLYALKSTMKNLNMSEGNMVEAIRSYGVPMQELLATSLFASGEMIRRERDFEGVKTEWVTPEDSFNETQRESMRKTADTTMEVVNDIINFQAVYIQPIIEAHESTFAAQNKAAKLVGAPQTHARNYAYAGQVSNIVNLMTYSMKARKAAELAIQQIKEGKKPTIAVENTFGSYVDEIDGDIKRADLGQIFYKGLESTLKYSIVTGRKPSKVEKEKARTEGLDDELTDEEKAYTKLEFNAYDELGEDGQKAYQNVLNKIKWYQQASGIEPLTLSPIDYIKEQIAKAGYKCGEITQRKKALVQNADGTYHTESMSVDKKDAARRFNGGSVEKPLPKEDTYDALILNVAGATGISLHASPKFGDSRPRTMIILQPARNVNTEVQMRGRIDRTGQLTRGEYYYLMSPVPAEGKTIMMLKHKLQSLDANSVGKQNVSSNKVDTDDMDNKYGDKVAFNFLKEHLYDINPELGSKGLTQDNKTRQWQEREGLLYDVLIGIQRMPCDTQEYIINELQQRYQQHVEFLNENGLNDLEVKVMPLDAVTIDTGVFVHGVNPESTSMFEHNTNIERVEVNVLKKPLRSEAIEKKMKALGSLTEDGIRKNNTLDFADELNEIESAKNEIIADKQKAYEEKERKFLEKLKQDHPKKEGQTDEEYEEFITHWPTYQNLLFKDADDLTKFTKENDRQYSMVFGAFMNLVTGRPYFIPLTDNLEGGKGYGRLIGFDTSGKKPRSIKAVFAVKDSRSTVAVPIVMQNDMIARIVDDGKDLELSDIADYEPANERLAKWNEWWDKKIPKDLSRQIRYMITENVIQACGQLGNYKGQVVTFTRKDKDTGEVTTDRGMLLSEDFDPEDFVVRKVVTKDFVWNATDKVTDEVSGISVRREGDNLAIEFYKKGKKPLKDHPAMKDDELKKLAINGEIYPIGKETIACQVSEKDAEAALEHLLKKYGFTRAELFVMPNSMERPDAIIPSGKPYEEVIKEFSSKYHISSAWDAQNKINKDLKRYKMDVNNEELKTEIRELVLLRQAYYRRDKTREESVNLAWKAMIEEQKIKSYTNINSKDNKRARDDAFNQLQAMLEELDYRGVHGTEYHLAPGDWNQSDAVKLAKELYDGDEFNNEALNKIEKIIEGLQLEVMLTENIPTSTGGQTAGDMIEYNWKFLNSKLVTDKGKSETILHEMTHTATVYALRAVKWGYDHMLPESVAEAAHELNDIFSIIEYDDAFENPTYIDYGTTNVYEMIAEFGSNPVFREHCKNCKIKVKVKDGFTQFYNAKRDILGAKELTAYDVIKSRYDILINEFSPKGYKEFWRGTGYGARDYSDIPTETLAEDIINGKMSRDEVKKAINELQARKDENGFYSPAEKAVVGIQQNKATGEQWLKMIENAGGLKKEEDKWLGLSDFLKDKKSVTKQEVLDFIRENNVEVVDVNYADSSAFDPFIDGGRGDKWEYFNNWIDQNTDNPEEWKERLSDVRYTEHKGYDLIFNNHSDEDEELINKINNSLPFIRGNQPHSLRLKYTTDGLRFNREIALVVPNIGPYKANDDIHFGDAGEGRAVAWVRFGDATDVDENNVLVIDEIQSKRHQDGRENGYLNTDAIRDYNQACDTLTSIRKYIKNKYGLDPLVSNIEIFDNPDVSETDKTGLRLAVEKQENAAKVYNTVGNVPDAPFRKNWQELTMKRMLRYAAENGYDKVAWTTGTQQSDRYNLSQVVDSLSSEKINGSTMKVEIGWKNFDMQATELEINKETGIIEHCEMYPDATGDLTGKKLSEVVGKDASEKLLQDETDLRGENLKFAGKGMTGFYDEMLPRFMDKYCKKWGTHTQDVKLDLPNEEDQVMHSVDVTPDMRESVMNEGQAKFLINSDANKNNSVSLQGEDDYNDVKKALTSMPLRVQDILGVPPTGDTPEERAARKRLFDYRLARLLKKPKDRKYSKEIDSFEDNMAKEVLSDGEYNSFKAHRDAVNKFAKEHKGAPQRAMVVVNKEMLYYQCKARGLNFDYYNHILNNMGNEDAKAEYEYSKKMFIVLRCNNTPEFVDEMCWHESGHRAIQQLGITKEQVNALYDELRHDSYLEPFFDETDEKYAAESIDDIKEEGIITIFGHFVGGEEEGIDLLLYNYQKKDKNNIFERIYNYINNGQETDGTTPEDTKQASRVRMYDSEEEQSDLTGKNGINRLFKRLDERNKIRSSLIIQNSTPTGTIDYVTSAMWDKEMEDMANQIRTVSVDRFTPILRFQDLLAKNLGIKIRDDLNAHQAMNQLSSKNLSDMKIYNNNFVSILKDAMVHLADKPESLFSKDGKTMDEIEEYTYAKHAVERNREKAIETYAAKVKEDFPDLLDEWQEDKERIINDDSLTWRQQQEALDELLSSYGVNYRKTPDMGLMAKLGIEDDGEVDFRQVAYDFVEDFESTRTPEVINNYWNAIRTVTDFNLDFAMKSGLSDSKFKERMHKRWQYYVPLRGFDEELAQDVYSYVTDMNKQMNGNPLVGMKGRKSAADNIFGAIVATAYGTIIKGNENLAKQRFLNLARKAQSGAKKLVKISDPWVVKYSALKDNPTIFEMPEQAYEDDEYVEAVPRLNGNETAEELQAKMEAFHNKLKELSLDEDGLAMKVSNRNKIPYRTLFGQAKQHMIAVREGGNDYFVTILGDPAVTQAINGQLNPGQNKGIYTKYANYFNRVMSANFTSRNPAFAVANTMRDSQFALNNAIVNETYGYASHFFWNQLKTPFQIMQLYYKYLHNPESLAKGSETQKLFKEFMDNGGPIGYTFTESQRDYAEEYKKDIRKLSRKMTTLSEKYKPSSIASKLKRPQDAVKYIVDMLEGFSECSELINRFAAYKTSRQVMGRSVSRSVEDAHKISIDFAQKGSGKQWQARGGEGRRKIINTLAGLTTYGQDWVIFFNANIQGKYTAYENLYGNAIKGNKAKAWKAVFSQIVTPTVLSALTMGVVNNYILPMMFEALGWGSGDDDKDEYDLLNDYTRRNKVCIRLPYNGWATIPIDPEIQTWWALGDIVYGACTGKPVSFSDFSQNIISALSPTNINWDRDADEFWVNMLPSTAQPWADLLANSNFLGYSIYKEDPYNATPGLPQYKRVYNNTSKSLTWLSQKMNSWKGDQVIASGYDMAKDESNFLDWNPAKIQHLIRGYLGGISDLLLGVADFTLSAVNGEDLNTSTAQMPFVGRFYQGGSTKLQTKRVDSKYKDIRMQCERMQKINKRYDDESLEEWNKGNEAVKDLLQGNKKKLQMTRDEAVCDSILQTGIINQIKAYEDARDKQFDEDKNREQLNNANDFINTLKQQVIDIYNNFDYEEWLKNNKEE